MLRIRLFEEKSIEVFQAGELPGFLHAYIGEEAVETPVPFAPNLGNCVIPNAERIVEGVHALWN